MAEENSNQQEQTGQEATTQINPATGEIGGLGNTNIIYILYLVGLVVPLVSLIGVVMAYLARGDGEPWMESHYTFQIRTFWISFLIGIIGVILSFVLVGFLVLGLLVIWYIVRCVKGLMAVSKQEAISDPQSWMFG